jgi:hypothetical protein
MHPSLRATRKPCVTCFTTHGPLRRRCPICGAPVCNACYPQRHAIDCAENVEAAVSLGLRAPAIGGE